MEAMVRDHELGRVASSLAPADLAAAIGALLDRPAGERASERERIATLARERFSWPATAGRYRDLVAATVEPADSGRPAPGI
jgi:glycosyltransferase involved in cell wall biosynthesis